MKYLKMTIFTLIFGLATPAWATGTSSLSIRKGASIEVRSWDPQVQAVEVKIVNTPAVGPNFADIDDFIKAMNFKGSKAKSVKADPSSIKGVVMSLKGSLKTLNYEELKSRLPKDLKKDIEKKEAKGRAKAKKSK